MIKFGKKGGYKDNGRGFYNLNTLDRAVLYSFTTMLLIFPQTFVVFTQLNKHWEENMLSEVEVPLPEFNIK